MLGPVFPIQENAYEILIEDADGRRLCLETLHDLINARERLKSLSTSYPQCAWSCAAPRRTPFSLKPRAIEARFCALPRAQRVGLFRCD